MRTQSPSWCAECVGKSGGLVYIPSSSTPLPPAYQGVAEPTAPSMAFYGASSGDAFGRPPPSIRLVPMRALAFGTYAGAFRIVQTSTDPLMPAPATACPRNRATAPISLIPTPTTLAAPAPISTCAAYRASTSMPCRSPSMRETGADGLVVAETTSVTTVHRREWSRYDAAQQHEGEHFPALIAELCDGIEQPDQPATGRPRLPMADVVQAIRAQGLWR